MNILITADPELPVPPRLYGGIERVIALLAAGLQARGHAVTLVAHAESCVPVDLVPYPEGARGGLARTVRHAAVIARAAARRRVEIVQSFSRLAYLAPLLALRMRKVMSFQRAVTPRTVRLANRLAHGTLAFTGCSRQLIRPVEATGRWHVVYNALDVDRYAFVPDVAPDAPFVFLGRIEAIKGTHLAIDVARRTGRRLVIAGNVPDHADARAYFRTAVEPHIDGTAVSYAGPVDDRAKAALLGGAAALLMPILWEEPFGIVMIEAMACGTPVIGLCRGAVPEVVEHGITGFVSADADEMVASAAHIGELSRSACRRTVERRFSQGALVDAYEAIYASLLARPV